MMSLRPLHKLLIPITVLLFVSVSGCATKEDLDRFYLTLDKKISDNVEDTNRTLSRVKKDFERFKGDDFSRFHEETSSALSVLQESVEKNGQFNKSIRRSQAGFGEDVNNLRTEVQTLRGALEELKMEVKSLESKPAGKGTPTDIDDKLNDIVVRLDYLEQVLEVEKREAPGAESAKGTAPAETVDKEKIYSDAYGAFKNGEYGTARVKFQEFLKAFPDSEYSDNAQFWVGECYYFEGKYEKAILEYEKVIKNYSKGNKVPNALLKQAFSFLKLGDQASTKLLLQRVIKDYPGTTPARIARQRLANIK